MGIRHAVIHTAMFVNDKVLSHADVKKLFGLQMVAKLKDAEKVILKLKTLSKAYPQHGDSSGMLQFERDCILSLCQKVDLSIEAAACKYVDEFKSKFGVELTKDFEGNRQEPGANVAASSSQSQSNDGMVILNLHFIFLILDISLDSRSGFVCRFG